MNETLRITFLRHLAEHPASVTAGFRQWAPPSRPTRAAAQTWAGEILKRLEAQGLATRNLDRPYEVGDRHREASGVEKRFASHGMKKPQPSHAWWITAAGSEYLRGIDASHAAAQAELARRAAREASAACAIKEIGPLCSPSASRGDRAILAQKLRAAGCTLSQIGLLFGVSREMIRLDLLPYAERDQQALTRKRALSLAFFRVGGSVGEGMEPTEPVLVACIRCGGRSGYFKHRDDGGFDRTAPLDELVAWARGHQCKPDAEVRS